MSLTVGQKLYYVPGQRGGIPRETTVTKVGRKWADLDGFLRLRIDIKTLYADGGQFMSPGRCYLSKQHYEDELALATAWAELRRLFDRNHAAPTGVSINQITNAKRALFKDAP